MRFPSSFALASCLVLAACNTGSPAPAPKPEPTTQPTTTTTAAAPSATGNAAAPRAWGSPIDAQSKIVALGDVSKNPDAFTGKSFTTTGTVTAVCEHMGCWMEIKDEASAAHIKMAGHKFFVPRSVNGKKARVQATLVKPEGEAACGDGQNHEKGKGCKAEAEQKLGRPLAKLELVADGVELL